MAMFFDLIRNLAAIDLPLSNQYYTWSNMQRRHTLAKLDRFSLQRNGIFPSYTIKSRHSLEPPPTTPQSSSQQGPFHAAKV